ncbi:MAG: transcriptional regulator, partial [Gammaproteobacteria bacterium]|nr:transcriptional regulator [Gammaproteobacteria bacterium]
IDVCVNDPGKNVDVYITTTVVTMAEVWMGQINYRKAVADNRLKVVGPKALTGDLGNWMAASVFADIAPASEIL